MRMTALCSNALWFDRRLSEMISHACAHEPCTMNDTTQFIANAVILCDVCIVCNMIWQKIIPLLSLSYNSKITRGCLASHVMNCDKFILCLDREVKLKVCWNMVTFFVYLYFHIFVCLYCENYANRSVQRLSRLAHVHQRPLWPPLQMWHHDPGKCQDGDHHGDNHNGKLKIKRLVCFHLLPSCSEIDM